MDAMLEENLTVDGYWAAYVGNVTPLEFMNRLYSPDITECVEEYMAGVPKLFGIVRRLTWKEAFAGPTQCRAAEVIPALVEKLETTEADWRPHLNQRPRPEPTPEVLPLPPVANDDPMAEMDGGEVAQGLSIDVRDLPDGVTPEGGDLTGRDGVDEQAVAVAEVENIEAVESGAEDALEIEQENAS